MRIKDYWIMGAMAFVGFALAVIFAVAIAFALASGITWGLAKVGVSVWPKVQPILWGLIGLLLAPFFMGEAMAPLADAYQRMQSRAARRRR